MTIEKAIKLIEETYAAVKDPPGMRNPLAYAIYQAWNVADREGEKKE